MIKTVTLFSHRSKDDNWSVWGELGQPDNNAGRRFAYMGYELELRCDVDTDTGEATLYAVNGIDLTQPLKIS